MRVLPVLSFLALLLSCASAAPSSETGGGSPTAVDSTDMNLTGSDSGQAVALHAGQHVTIRLQSIGPNGYGDPAISSPSVTFVGVTYPMMQNPGGPTKDYRFLAASTGSAVIRIAYIDPDGNEAPSRAFNATLNVSN